MIYSKTAAYYNDKYYKGRKNHLLKTV